MTTASESTRPNKCVDMENGLLGIELRETDSTILTAGPHASSISSLQPAPSSTAMPTIDKFIGFKRHADVEGEGGEHSWLFHLIDIIYVATMYRINVSLSACGDIFDVYLLTAAYFIIMFLTRLSFDQYKCTFQAKGIIHTFVFLLYCTAVFIMTLNIGFHYGDDDGDGGFGEHCSRVRLFDSTFGAAFMVSRTILLVLYALYLFLLARRAPLDLEMKQIALCKLLPVLMSCGAMVAIFFSADVLVVFPVVAVIELGAHFLPEMLIKVDYVQPDPVHLEERLGLFFMLILGEGVLGLLTQNYNTEHTDRDYLVLISAFVLMCMTGFQYFNRTRRYISEDQHPMRKPGYAAAFVLCFLAMSFCMMIACDGMVEIYRSVNGNRDLDEEETSIQKQKIACGLFLVWVFMLSLRLLDTDYLAKLGMAIGGVQGGEVDRESFQLSPGILESSPHTLLVSLLVKICTALLHLLIFYTDVPTKEYVGLHAVLMVLPILLELGLDFRLFLQKHRSTEQTLQADVQDALEGLFLASHGANDRHTLSMRPTEDGRMPANTLRFDSQWMRDSSAVPVVNVMHRPDLPAQVQVQR